MTALQKKIVIRLGESRRTHKCCGYKQQPG
jgi:hypothetical protein